ncbi:uncharacterized protein LOC128675967 isoform X2 [Plodia interpunctella]|nr:uncharacterized protein LOC128675967 isoform X2 [Plodia interpunctella]
MQHHSQIYQLLKHNIAQDTYISQIVFIHMIKYDGDFNGECVVEFLTATACKAIEDILKGVTVEGRKLDIEPNAKNRITSIHRIKRQRNRLGYESKQGSKIEHMVKNAKTEDNSNTYSNQFRTNETYGLSVKFLTDLGIQPPLTNRVIISNLGDDVTETKIREVFSYAGQVVTATVFNKKNKILARVQFDHPVEAVQAVSMFHNKELYNRRMCVEMHKWNRTTILPEGITSVGMGLGANGEPMSSVRHTIELEPLKKLLLKELDKMQNLKSGANQSEDNANQYQNNIWNNNQSDNSQNDNSAGNPMNMLMQSVGGNLGSLGWVLQQAIYSQMQNQCAYGNMSDQNAYANQIMANQGAVANQNVANQSAFGNQSANQNALNQPQSRFDVPPNALTVVQSTMVNQNDLVKQVQQLAYQQNASMWQTPQATKTRFDIPPSGVTQNVGTNVGQSWNTGNWPQTQAPSQASNYDRGDSSYDRSDNCYGSSIINHDEFDVSRLSDAKTSESKTSDMLLFTNLPSSVTSQALVNKMNEVGPLKFAEITGQGRAIVRFQQGRDAERCIKLYDRSKVDGQVISVKFV